MPEPTPTYPVSVKGVVLREGRVLLLRNDRGEWELPGGRLERDETPQQCVTREIAEEVGWAVHPERLIDAWVYRIEQARREVFIVTYGCLVDHRPGHGEPVVSDEHLEARLFRLEELPGLPLPAGYQRSIGTWQRLLGESAGEKDFTRRDARP